MMIIIKVIGPVFRKPGNDNYLSVEVPEKNFKNNKITRGVLIRERCLQ